MNQVRTILLCALLVTTLCSWAASAQAASLQEVNNWNGNNVPSDVSMSIYVPDNVADNPPVLLLVHYCGGTASAVFGQAQGGGIVRAADQYGFIMVVPSSGRCWDVQSDQTWTRGGGGDSDAIMQMVDYAIENYDGNPERVYVTGDSSGGMMTELLLGLYPDVFKAGSALAGMPAACRGDNESGNGGGYSGACAGGNVNRSAEEWGDIARALNPGYTGHHPRVQIFHGDNDTIINFNNHTQAIKQWTNVLGLDESPTTEENVQLGDHQATRQTWESSCGIPVLDAFTSLGGDHGPSDALFLAEYVIPFLGLDVVGPVDPEIEQCGDGGDPGAGAGGAGGSSGDGGDPEAGTGGADMTGAGGTPPMDSPEPSTAGMSGIGGGATDPIDDGSTDPGDVVAVDPPLAGSPDAPPADTPPPAVPPTTPAPGTTGAPANTGVGAVGTPTPTSAASSTGAPVASSPVGLSDVSDDGSHASGGCAFVEPRPDQGSDVPSWLFGLALATVVFNRRRGRAAN